MTMRLLTPTQAQAEARGQRVLLAAREKEVITAIDKRHHEKAVMEADFKEMLASQVARWEKEEREHEELVSARMKEIEVLDHRREMALLPVKELMERAREQYQKAAALCEDYSHKQAQCDATQEAFEIRFDALQEEKEAVLAGKKDIQRRLKGVEMQEKYSVANAKIVSEGIERLRVEGEKFTFQCDKMEASFEALRLSLDVREKELDEREVIVNDRYDKVYILEIMNSSPLNESPVKNYHG